MKTLLFILLSFHCSGQLILLKITPKKELSTNLDSVFRVRLPISHNDSVRMAVTYAKLKIKLYNVVITDADGKILASKQPGKPFTGSLAKALEAFTFSIINADKNYIFYRPEELYENRFPDHLDVFRKSDSTKLASFTYTPLRYVIPKR